MKYQHYYPRAPVSCTLDNDCMAGNVCGQFKTCVVTPSCWKTGNCKDGDYCRVSDQDCGMEGIYKMTCKNLGTNVGECSR